MNYTFYKENNLLYRNYNLDFEDSLESATVLAPGDWI
jgi:hypothetical protein